MKQHKSTSKDNQLLSEMYGQIGGMTIQTTGNADEAAEQLAQDDGFNNPEEAAENKRNMKKLTYSVGSVGGQHSQIMHTDKTFDSLEDACNHAGVDVSECIAGEWDDMGDGTKEYGVDEDTVIVMHIDKAEDGEGHHENKPEDEAYM